MQEVADELDDRTLLRHIVRIFGVRKAPRNNEGWQKVILVRIVETIGQFGKEFREIPPRE